MSDLNCPYCDADLEVCHDDGAGYAEDRLHEMECGECGKNFVFSTSIHYYYDPRKADCLNGEPHNVHMSTTYPRRYSKMQCKDCDYARKPTPEEFAAAGINPNE